MSIELITNRAINVDEATLLKYVATLRRMIEWLPDADKDKTVLNNLVVVLEDSWEVEEWA